MALQQQYTWHDHLTECPRCNGKDRAKHVPRTSKDGAACFEKSYVVHIKDYLKSRIAHIEDEKKRVANIRKLLMKRFIEEKDTERARRLGETIGQREAYLIRLDHQLARDKERHKKF